MEVKDIKKGDIVTYRNGRINNVNYPKKYKKWFDRNFENKGDRGLDIIQIQRYVKFLFFYRLKTIYKRGE